MSLLDKVCARAQTMVMTIIGVTINKFCDLFSVLRHYVSEQVIFIQRLLILCIIIMSFYFQHVFSHGSTKNILFDIYSVIG